MRSIQSRLLPGIAFLALGIVGLTILIPYGIESPASVQYRALSPSYWPNIVCVAVSIIGLVLVATSFFQNSTNDVASNGSGSRWQWLRPFIVMAVCIGLYFSLQTLGFVLTNIISMAILMLLGGERRIYLIAMVSVLTPLALYVFFTKATGVPIPAGVLEPLLVRI